ncbi:MAG TPA: prolipoprotein diacylglyceryl transferase [Patescibacteria group bacterium]|nr:prolipoprotein diacylglyceryl transferase [Patescibacteria group bacterium]
MLNFLHSFLPSPILLEAGPFKVYWYGLIMALAFFICFLVLLKLSRRQGLEKNQAIDLTFYLIVFGLVGARLWHVIFYNPSYFWAYPLEIVKVWHGGLAVHGSLLAGLLVIYCFSKKKRISFWRWSDLLAIVLPLGQAIGRWGNYFNQELYGLRCDYAWCMPIQGQPGYHHPVFLYESLLNLSLFALLLILFKTRKSVSGTPTFIYLIGYSIIRFLMEFLRLDISGVYLGLNWLQWLCLAVIIVAAYLLVKGLAKKGIVDYNSSS